MQDYRRIADAIAVDIAAGRRAPGDRLPPQRQFARVHGIASSTAARVYGELIRRGLAVGEVGRGTFVRAGHHGVEPALAEPSDARIDLELNFPVLPGQPAKLAASLAGLLRVDALSEALRAPKATGTPAAREAAIAMLSRSGWTPPPPLFAGNGRQAIAAAIAALVPAGERLGVESITYPVVKAVAQRLGVTLVPLDMDDDGLLPDAVRAAAPLRAVYLQPTLHNPLGITMPAARRIELARVLDELDCYAIEDSIYAFLREEPAPLAAHAPERTVLVDGLSKRLAPGLTLGFAAAPAALHERMVNALRSGGWVAPRFAVEAGTRWMADGTAAEIAHAKREDATHRQRLVAERLAGFDVRADPRAYHCWWRLPNPWRAETFVAAAARHGIAITPAAAFTVGAGHAPNAVRLALSAPPRATLSHALDTLATLARSYPEGTAEF